MSDALMADVIAPSRLPDPRSGGHVLLTGVTGFVGQAILERLLSTTDAHVTVLVRARGPRTARGRLEQLLRKPAFDSWRRAVGETDAARVLDERVTVLEGDLRDVPPLPTDLTAVVHSASSVNFDDPIDKAFATNVGGAHALYAALHRTGTAPHVVHISTAYVSTGRTDVALEDSVAHDVDWRAELGRALEARAEVARASRDELSDADEVDRRLVRLGRERAAELGWTDAYTMTKALGERVAEELWAGAGHRLTVLRPTIIESALRYPFPGWIDGFKVADPLIAAYAQGRLVSFPGRPQATLDIVPVDVVVATVLASLRVDARPGAPGDGPAVPAVDYLHVGSGTTAPLSLAELRDHVMDYFRVNPWTTRDRVVVAPSDWEFSDPDRMHRWVRRQGTAIRLATAALGPLPQGWLRQERAVVSKRRRELDVMRRFVDLYAAYTCATTVYDDSRLRELAARTGDPLLDLTDLDWRAYLQEGHLPALVDLMNGRARRRDPHRDTRETSATVPENAPRRVVSRIA